jgi:hypothetical protein
MAAKSSEVNGEYLTPEDFLKTPEFKKNAEKLHWTRETLGVFYWSGIVDGYYVKKLRKCFILKSDLIELMRKANEITKRKLIDGID